MHHSPHRSVTLLHILTTLNVVQHAPFTPQVSYPSPHSNYFKCGTACTIHPTGQLPFSTLFITTLNVVQHAPFTTHGSVTLLHILTTLNVVQHAPFTPQVSYPSPHSNYFKCGTACTIHPTGQLPFSTLFITTLNVVQHAPFTPQVSYPSPHSNYF